MRVEKLGEAREPRIGAGSELGYGGERNYPKRPPLTSAGRPAGRSPADAHREQVLLLEARVVGRADVPLLAEALERLVELGLAPVALRIGPGDDGRAIALLEVLAIVVRALERRHVEHLTLEGPPLDAVAEQLAHVVLVAPQRRRLGAGRRRRRERPHRAEEGADHAFRRPAQEPDRALARPVRKSSSATGSW